MQVSTPIHNEKQPHTYQLLENALVQSPLFRPAVPELLVVVLEALPVGPELGKAVLVDVLDTANIVSPVLLRSHLPGIRTR
jgi:hypothetical protein